MKVLAVMDAYRVTGPARQLLATAVPRPDVRVMTAPVFFQRSQTPPPVWEAAIGAGIDPFLLRDRFPGDPRVVVGLHSLVKRSHFDLLQTHGYKANVIGRLIAPFIRQPWIAFLHGETQENWKVRAYFALERQAIRQARKVVVVSHEMASRFIQWGIQPCHIRVVHNACLTERLHEDSTCCGKTDGIQVIGVIGRLSPEKGVDIALRTHELVARRYRETQMWIAGEGPERVRLEKYAEQLGIGHLVQWLGYRDNVSELYRRISVLLIPSRSEGLPNVALEAMAHGIPVVASAVGGTPEVVSDGRTGFLVSSQDVQGFANRILALLEQTWLRRELGRQARMEVRERFSLTARLEALKALYEEILQ